MSPLPDHFQTEDTRIGRAEHWVWTEWVLARTAKWWLGLGLILMTLGGAAYGIAYAIGVEHLSPQQRREFVRREEIRVKAGGPIFYEIGHVRGEWFER